MSSYYLKSVLLQFNYYKELGDKTIDQIPENKLSYKVNAQTNSINTIVKHLSGNMASRWSDFLTTDGEKKWRNREDEFNDTIQSKEDLIHLWNKGWEILFNSLEQLTDDDLEKINYIRSFEEIIGGVLMSKSNLLIPFGLVNGVMKFVDDVPNGKESGAICAACNNPLIARNGGSRRAHHFAHAHQTACENGVETAIHKMAKQVLLDYKEIQLPESRKSVQLELGGGHFILEQGGFIAGEPVIIPEQRFSADDGKEEV